MPEYIPFILIGFGYTLVYLLKVDKRKNFFKKADKYRIAYASAIFMMTGGVLCFLLLITSFYN